MRGTLIMALAIALFAIIFALQNSGQVNVHVGPGSFQAPLALILLLTLAAGVLAGYLATISKMFRMGSEIRKQKKALSELQQESLDVANEQLAPVEEFSGDNTVEAEPSEVGVKPQ